MRRLPPRAQRRACQPSKWISGSPGRHAPAPLISRSRSSETAPSFPVFLEHRRTRSDRRHPGSLPNPLLRLNREVKRPTHVVGIFPNDDAIIRLVVALMLEQNEEWAVTRRYMTQVCEDQSIDVVWNAAP